MRLNRHSWAFPSQKGVALVITLIMLSVITFMAITFLAISRRQKGSVNVAHDQTAARLAANDGSERATAEILAGILANGNAWSFGLLPSTNYVSWFGYDYRPATQTLGIPNVTNVNFAYKFDGARVFTLDEQLQNIANSFYNPSPPVFVTNRAFANSYESRAYLDLNRNRMYDTNGYWPVISDDPSQPFYRTNGSLTATLAEAVFSHQAGDPEWIGVLARPEFPHSATNQYIARYAYLVVPSGLTLDVNYIHNQAKQPQPAAEGFLRNQGVGSWEMNLAGFLVDLNTNMWHSDPKYATQYYYDTAASRQSRGSAFDDATALTRYRYLNNYRSLPNVSGALGPFSVVPCSLDMIDSYSAGPLMTDYWGWNIRPDPDSTRVSSPNWHWPGAYNPQHYFNTQDFFDRTKVLPVPNQYNFTDRLLIAGTNNNNSIYGPSTYDRSTFYRLLSQLGTDSAPEPPGKINVNYRNVAGSAVTNFEAWAALDFFTNAADRLLQTYSREWLGVNEPNAARRGVLSNYFLAVYGTNQPFGIANIPVFVNSNFVYTPSIHRVLQLAANIYDASTNRPFLSGQSYQFPSVFRPVFRRQGNNIYIAGYQSVETVSGGSDPRFSIPRDLRNPADVSAVPPAGTPLSGPETVNVYGVPWVIGAKKGLPNFNEFAMQTVFQISRKLELTRRTIGGAPNSAWRTNMVYSMGISNVVGVEAWNSYSNNYSRAVNIIVVNDIAMSLTNNYWPTGIRTNTALAGTISLPATGPTQWRGFRAGESASFLTMRTNVIFLPDAAYRASPPGFVSDPNLAWDKSQLFLQPQWGLNVTNHLRVIMIDTATQRVIDYVQLNDLDGKRDLSEEVRDPDFATGYEGLWSTNLLSGRVPQGIMNQIAVSRGEYGTATSLWKPYGTFPAGTNPEFEIDKFRVFVGLSPLRSDWPAPIDNKNLGLVAQVPFTPAKRFSQYLTWQANDPLVHYTAGDLTYLAIQNSPRKENLSINNVQTLENLGKLNNRYKPWGGNDDQATDPDKFNLAVKDPGMRRSDDWQFPTNKFPNIGWLGRVHRGTPWQTVYMKSSVVETNTWRNWTGNGNFTDALFTQPINDRVLFDVFSTAFNENATRGQLSINQPGLAAWSAVFSGVVALTNSSANSELTKVPSVVRITPALNRAGTDYGIDPAGTDGTNSAIWQLVNGPLGINAARTNFAGGVFRRLGDVLSAPALTERSPFLNQRTAIQVQKGINDAMYEWLPQQVMGLLRVGEPRFVIYSFGQTLHPAPDGTFLRGNLLNGLQAFNGMVTNYQVTAEVATRTVVRVENAPTGFTPTQPRIVIESFNLLPPD